MNYSIRLAHLFITMACPNECEHCLFACSVNDSWMNNDLIEKTIKEFKYNNVINVRIMGGEPFFNLEKFFFAFNTLQKYYKRSNIMTITSGFFAKNQKITDDIIKRLQGIKLIELSVDRFHQKKVPMKNIINLMNSTKKYSIPVSFSFMIDDLTSKNLIESMAYLVNKYENSYFHIQKLDIKGRAEKFDYILNQNFKKNSEYLLSLIKRKKYPKIFYETIKNELHISLSVTPNGDVFSCCDLLKNTYMGNIKEKPLEEIIKNSIGSTANKFIEIGCNNFKFLSPLDKDKCDICRDFPMKKNLEISTKKWIGRIFIEIDENKLGDLGMLKTKIKKLSNRELLIRFKFNDIKKAKKYKDKILHILDWMKLEKIRFRISRPLPPCIINNEILNRFQIPKNCYECHELFSIENEKVIACPYHFKIELGNFNNFKNRKEIYEEFIRKIKIMKFNKYCKTCIYKTRNKCEIPCINLIVK